MGTKYMRKIQLITQNVSNPLSIRCSAVAADVVKYWRWLSTAWNWFGKILPHYHTKHIDKTIRIRLILNHKHKHHSHMHVKYVSIILYWAFKLSLNFVLCVVCCRWCGVAVIAWSVSFRRALSRVTVFDLSFNYQQHLTHVPIWGFIA